MILYPAIDIRGGHAVRLRQGDFDQETVYDADPLDAALRWTDEGAEALHVVDLDGARTGSPQNLDHLRRIADTVDVPIQYGGGLRDLGSVAAALEAGASRAILGTAAYRDPDLLAAALEAHGDRLAVSVDARGGQVAVSGWADTAETPAADLIRALSQVGVTRLVCTSIERDGMLSGPDPDEALGLAAAAEPAELIYSGGIGSLEHLRTLAGLGIPNLAGVISGKALYEGCFTVAEGQAALAGGAL